jgi:hypothetical protein
VQAGGRVHLVPGDTAPSGLFATLQPEVGDELWLRVVDPDAPLLEASLALLQVARDRRRPERERSVAAALQDQARLGALLEAAGAEVRTPCACSWKKAAG